MNAREMVIGRVGKSKVWHIVESGTHTLCGLPIERVIRMQDRPNPHLHINVYCLRCQASLFLNLKRQFSDE